MKLDEFFAEHPKAALAFSGGTDSAFLLYAARSAGADVRPYLVSLSFSRNLSMRMQSGFPASWGLSFAWSMQTFSNMTR